MAFGKFINAMRYVQKIFLGGFFWAWLEVLGQNPNERILGWVIFKEKLAFGTPYTNTSSVFSIAKVTTQSLIAFYASKFKVKDYISSSVFLHWH